MKRDFSFSSEATAPQNSKASIVLIYFFFLFTSAIVKIREEERNSCA